MIDKMEILGSPLGMYSLLREEENGSKYIISVLDDNGEIDIPKLEKLLISISNMGANGIREFPFWIDSYNSFNKISPFKLDSRNFYYFEDKYFYNQMLIAKYCNKYNLKYYFSIFDHCGTKIDMYNPWNRFNDFFYGEDAKDLRHRWIDKLITYFQGLNVGYELCNEPKQKQGIFLADTFLYLIEKGVKPENIILGIDYRLKESVSQYKTDYKNMRDIIVKKLGKEWSQNLKSVCISPVHNSTTENIKEFWGDDVNAGGTRRVLYSTDGVREFKKGIEKSRPDKTYMYNLTLMVLNQKKKARENGKILFEVVYGKTDNSLRDPLNSLEGVSEAYKEIWGIYPENWKRFVLDEPIVEVEEIVENTVEKVEIKPEKSNDSIFIISIIIIIFILFLVLA